MKLSIAISQGRWEIAAHLIVLGLVRASKQETDPYYAQGRNKKQPHRR